MPHCIVASLSLSQISLFASFRCMRWWMMFYVGFTPYANILHPHRVLWLNAMWCDDQAPQVRHILFSKSVR